MTAALARDPAPLVRLAALASSAGDVLSRRGPAADDDDTRKNSDALSLATTCTDILFPWAGDAPARVRRRSANQAVRGIPRAALAPLGSDALVATSPLARCLGWPDTSLDRARIGGRLSPAPATRTLILQGDADLRTPLSDAEEIVAELPAAILVRVPHQGHSVATDARCARAVLARFLADEAVDPAACAAHPAVYAVQPVPPRHLAAIRLPLAFPDTAGGRTLAAVALTLNDLALASLSATRRGATVGGLRAGRAVRQEDAGRESPFLLRSYAYVAGVELDGIFAAGVPFADVTVTGRRAARGRVTIFADRSIHAELGDETIDIGGEASAVELAAPRAIRPLR